MARKLSSQNIISMMKDREAKHLQDVDGLLDSVLVLLARIQSQLTETKRDLANTERGLKRVRKGIEMDLKKKDMTKGS
ncbi:MAG: hypothetical protein V3R87_02855 [Dehalococcoidia bacterium]